MSATGLHGTSDDRPGDLTDRDEPLATCRHAEYLGGNTTSDGDGWGWLPPILLAFGMLASCTAGYLVARILP